MSSLNIDDFIQYALKTFQPEKAVGVDSQIQFELHDGKEVKTWTMVIKDQHCSIQAGAAQQPTFTLSAGLEDCIQIFTGKLDPAKAFMQGKVKLNGNMGKAMQLISLFKPS